MIERLGLSKIQALVSMAEGYEAQLAEKRAELDTARRLARQTRDETLQAQFIADAEELNASIANREAEHKEAREALDNFSAGIAWVDAALERIRAGIKDIDNPTEADIRAMEYEERRLLLAATGLYVRVWPQGYGKRVVADSRFDYDPLTMTVDQRYPLDPRRQSQLEAFVRTLPEGLTVDEQATRRDM
jgi:hypothetical protein